MPFRSFKYLNAELKPS